MTNKSVDSTPDIIYVNSAGTSNSGLVMASEEIYAQMTVSFTKTSLVKRQIMAALDEVLHGLETIARSNLHDEEYFESADVFPRAAIINHEQPVVSVRRKYTDSFGIEMEDD